MTYDTRDFNADLMHSFCNYMFTNGWTLGVIDTEYGDIETIINTEEAVKTVTSSSTTPTPLNLTRQQSHG